MSAREDRLVARLAFLVVETGYRTLREVVKDDQQLHSRLIVTVAGLLDSLPEGAR